MDKTMTIVIQKAARGGCAFAVGFDGEVPQSSQAYFSTLAEGFEHILLQDAHEHFGEPARYPPRQPERHYLPAPQPPQEFQTQGSGIAADMPNFMGKPSDLDLEQRGIIQGTIDKLKGKNGNAHLSVVLACMFMVKLAGSVLGA